MTAAPRAVRMAAVSLTLLLGSMGMTAPGATPVVADAPEVAAESTDASTGTAGQVDRRLMVRWSETATDNDRRRVLDAAGIAAGTERRRLDPRTDAYELTALDGPQVAALANRLLTEDAVDFAEPDRSVEIALTTQDPVGIVAPNDPLFRQQWGLQNVGQVTGAGENTEVGVAGVDARVLPAWNITRGSPEVSIAVIDTAVDHLHPDLAGAVTTRLQTLAQLGPVPPPGSHGTAVAGVAAARADDGFGMAGVAPETSIVSIAAFEATSSGTGTTTLAAIVAALDAAARSGADVIAASWTTRIDSPLLAVAVADVGVPIVAAAGNDGEILQPETPVFPAGYDEPHVVSVTSIGPQGTVPMFANVGAEAIDVAAPGVGVLTPVVGGQHGFQTGTSFSVPFVAGAIALAASVAPYASSSELVDAVSWTSAARPELVGNTRSGGMLDTDALVRGIQRPVCRPDQQPSADFPDVAPGNVHRSGIDCLLAQQLTTGRLDGTYGPSDEVTRAQLASFLARLIDRVLVDDPPPPADLVDVAPDAVHAAAIDRLVDLGVVRVGEDRRFRPDAAVTRGQAAALLGRTYAVVTGDDQAPSRRWFVDTDGGIHADGIDRARDLGIVAGVDRVTFDAGSTLRRDQMASLLARSMDALGRQEVALG